MWSVYVMESAKDSNLHVGMATDVNARFVEHEAGKVKSTKGRRPFRLIYVEEVGTRSAARAREKYLKSGGGRRWLKKKFGRRK